jgi:drug/metabolite transporter (DMT)-like permease
MAATKSQGSAFTLFMAGLTAVCAGIAYLYMGSGKVSLILGLIAVLYSLWSFIKIKPLEGKVAMKMQPAALQLAGVVAAFLGWAFVLFGLHLTSSVSGRFATTLIGFAVTLIGVLYILPKASSKNAIWKA